MDVDDALAQQLQRGERYGGVVDEGTTLACGGNLAAHDALGVVLYLVVLKQRFQAVARDVEGALDDTLGGSCAYGSGLGTLAREQAYGTEEDRLTGTRLTCDDRETRGKVEVERLYAVNGILEETK